MPPCYSGLAVGYEDKTFKPDQHITRAEMIAITVELDGGRNVEPLPGFTLTSASSHTVQVRVH